MNVRHRVLGGALACTLGATAWMALRPADEAIVEAATRARAAAPTPVSPAASVPDVERPLVRQQPLRWPGTPAQQVAAWGPPPAPPPAPPPPAPVVAPQAPPRPTMPPFPYQWIGRLDDGSSAPQALLAGPQRTIAARAGDTVDGHWRIDKVDATAVQLTWLPGPAAHTLRLPPL